MQTGPAHDLGADTQYHLSGQFGAPYRTSDRCIGADADSVPTLQIISLQACHYMTLSIIVPPLLSAFTSPDLLEYSGGSRAVGHIMDWREMAARPAVPMGSTWERIRGAWAGGKKVGTHDTGAWDYGVDDKRGWVLGFAWIIATAVE